ncbi:cysteine--tRNA ligase [Buchnera aphidicola]|uniref:Cysteine--tRNA ligase n=1 Tax=Buchnera aphidicola str. USDA (Myzus persicae) TaxID=1009856 RepID=W0NZJ3_BUCMP|nr:cysteine--tRNA ligase [Buchnera aphidicola]AHG59911.1 Cyss [Buchnera aphidicola str. USDA (Myzus persicae)]AHG60491.1 Cyss [Buchnera aphidicola str. W106 (Myzus persicae)]AHG61064.1 Cyss [Buchnera aphidicola str. G002 (Myzus persicae)]AHG61636.1 Cyss [Buchnera aphidicola str. F009 (Myzus persicae)]WAI02851.1 MAG: cysteine--tRNA ligase [Buchnera aphidicola (Myzus persicae)]
MLKIFNTLTRKKEIFKSIEKNKINLYVCGVTVYDFCHIGHGRTFVAFDMIMRYLRYSGFQVKYIRNITDIDDKIVLKSIKEKIDLNVLTSSMIKEMHKDFFSLGILPPDEEPCVTNHINHIINMILILLKKQHAYINEKNDVIFSVDSYPYYGILSGQVLKSLKSGSRVPLNNFKKNPLDFVLWKNSKKEEHSWHSPWGKGRPGWHIECSTITSVFFKNSIDIHGGGSDLLFPHHENERSQSICFNKKSIVNFWMHTGVLMVNNKKMSKSLGNVYLLRDVLKNYNAEVLRYFFLSTHYRHPIDYSEKNLQQSYTSLKYLYTALYNTNPNSDTIEGSHFIDDFHQAMNDDFNTPTVFSIFFKLAKEINFLKKQNMFKANKLSFILRNLANTLGFLLQDPESFLQEKSRLTESMIKKIEYLINKRNIARQCKLWKEADNLRKTLLSLDIVLEDLHDKTIWRKK